MAKKLLPDPDLQSLIRRLNTTAQGDPVPDIESDPSPTHDSIPVRAESARWKLPKLESAGEEWLNSLLAAARTAHASDVVFVVGVTPMARVHGRLRRLSDTPLAGIVSQTLLPRADGEGRIPAVEVLVATHAVHNLIRQGKIETLPSQLTLERGSG